MRLTKGAIVAALCQNARQIRGGRDVEWKGKSIAALNSVSRRKALKLICGRCGGGGCRACSASCDRRRQRQDTDRRPLVPLHTIRRSRHDDQISLVGQMTCQAVDALLVAVNARLGAKLLDIAKRTRLRRG